MSRSDGVYPSYAKLELDPNKPPAGWDYGARRCIKCKKSWPNMGIFSPSPCCNENAGVVNTAEPDMSWAEALSEVLRVRFERYYEKWNEGASDEQLMWMVDDDMPFSEHEYEEGLKEIERLISQEQHQ